MVSSCCVNNCTQRQQRGNGISFHSFPKDDELKKKWLIALKRDNFTPSSTTKICSLHFKQTDFVKNFGRKTLAKDCVPSIFNFPKHLESKTVKSCRKRLLTEANNDVMPLCSNQARLEIPTPNSNDSQNDAVATKISEARLQIPTPISNNGQNDAVSTKISEERTSRRNWFGDFTVNDLKTPEKAYKMWLCAKKTIDKHKRTIKYLHNRSYKLTKRIRSLENIIKHLAIDQLRIDVRDEWD